MMIRHLKTLLLQVFHISFYSSVGWTAVIAVIFHLHFVRRKCIIYYTLKLCVCILKLLRIFLNICILIEELNLQTKGGKKTMLEREKQERTSYVGEVLETLQDLCSRSENITCEEDIVHIDDILIVTRLNIEENEDALLTRQDCKQIERLMNYITIKALQAQERGGWSQDVDGWDNLNHFLGL